MSKGHDFAIFSPDGVQPKVKLGFIEWEDGECTTFAEGQGGQLLAGLGVIIKAIGEHAPTPFLIMTIMEALKAIKRGGEDDES